jgi:hypothetical protein
VRLLLAAYLIPDGSMNLLRLLSRAAFLCNLCFLFCGFILWLKHPWEGELVVLVIIMGYLLSALLNFIVNIWYFALWVRRKSITGSVPGWLILANFLFFILQLILLLK